MLICIYSEYFFFKIKVGKLFLFLFFALAYEAVVKHGMVVERRQKCELIVCFTTEAMHIYLNMHLFKC